MKTFGEILREKRLEKGWSQKQLASKLNTHVNAISAYETNKVAPSYLVVIDLADTFKCSIDELVGREIK